MVRQIGKTLLKEHETIYRKLERTYYVRATGPLAVDLGRDCGGDWSGSYLPYLVSQSSLEKDRLLEDSTLKLAGSLK